MSAQPATQLISLRSHGSMLTAPEQTTEPVSMSERNLRRRRLQSAPCIPGGACFSRRRRTAGVWQPLVDSFDAAADLITCSERPSLSRNVDRRRSHTSPVLAPDEPRSCALVCSCLLMLCSQPSPAAGWSVAVPAKDCQCSVGGAWQNSPDNEANSSRHARGALRGNAGDDSADAARCTQTVQECSLNRDDALPAAPLSSSTSATRCCDAFGASSCSPRSPSNCGPPLRRRTLWLR